MSPVRTLALAQLRADLRNPRTGRTGSSRVVTTAIAYAFSGLVLALSLGSAPPDYILFVAGSFGMVLAAFGVVGSYDELMGRPKENAWLATLPATEAQHYGARLVGIGMYVGLMAVSVSAPLALRVGIAHGIGAGVGVGTGVAVEVVWTSAVAIAVLWALTLAIPQRVLRSTLGAARTLLVGALVLGYQWIGTQPVASRVPWWPATWLAEAAAGGPGFGLAVLAGSSLALTAAFAGLFPGRYFRLLRRLADGARQAETRRRGPRLTRLERWAVPPGPARAAYGFAVAAFSDDRVVRGRLWPTALLPLGFVAFGWLAGGLESLFIAGPAAIFGEPATQLHLSVLVVLLFCVHALVQTLQFSDHAEAAWVFGTLPEARPRALQVGAQQALLVRVLLPLHIGIALLLSLQQPPLHAAVHALYWFGVSAVASQAQAVFYRTPPFSRQSDRFSGGARFVPLLASIPGAVLALGLQTLTFTSLGAAVLASLGLIVLAFGLGYVVTWTPRLSSPALPPARPEPLADPAVV